MKNIWKSRKKQIQSARKSAISLSFNFCYRVFKKNLFFELTSSLLQKLQKVFVLLLSYGEQLKNIAKIQVMYLLILLAMPLSSTILLVLNCHFLMLNDGRNPFKISQ